MTTVADVMTTDVQTLAPADTVGRLRDMLYLHDIGSVPIVDENDRLAGIVTNTDLVEDWAPDQVVRNVMQREVTTVTPSTPLEVAARMMRNRRIHHLVVREDDESSIIGIISSWDLLEAMAVIVAEARASTVPLHTVAPGDDLVMGELGQPGGRSGKITEVHGANGLPPYVVSWDDDPDATSTEIRTIRRGELPLDGCER